jgi:[FeFe] hydrogenase H-cluster maturation GTPase HydF
LFGRTNVGKSIFLNLLAGQDVAITSPEPGTTTDVVEKPMELLPVGPVVFIDTAGLDDATKLGERRRAKTHDVFNRADIVVLVCQARSLGSFEHLVLDTARKRGVPSIAVINETNGCPPESDVLKELEERTSGVIRCNAVDWQTRDRTLSEFKRLVAETCPPDFLTPPPLIGDLVPSGGLVVLIVPIDLQAPKGRLILPQVQTIRDALDHSMAAAVVKETEYLSLLDRLKCQPDLVVCDSQVVDRMVAETPSGVACTTFSILFARLKGDLVAFARGAGCIDRLGPSSRVLVAESCSHHPTEDDIGRVKIPRWLRQYAGESLNVDVCAGRDFPAALSDYDLVVQCGGCMHNRREILSRVERCLAAGVPITNYGLCISRTRGVLERVLTPFPEALDTFRGMQS